MICEFELGSEHEKRSYLWFDFVPEPDPDELWIWLTDESFPPCPSKYWLLSLELENISHIGLWFSGQSIMSMAHLWDS
jgi:hypothetical protein